MEETNLTNSVIDNENISNRSNKKKKKKAIIFILCLVSLLMIGSLSVLYSQFIKTKEYDKKMALDVVDKINEIGENDIIFFDNLASMAISKAEDAYAKLTKNQKKLVTNYNDLVEAKKEYESPTPFESGAIKAVKLIHENLKDPDSMKINDVQIYNWTNDISNMSDYMVVIDISAKNGFGGYGQETYNVKMPSCTIVSTSGLQSYLYRSETEKYKSQHIRQRIIENAFEN